MNKQGKEAGVPRGKGEGEGDEEKEEAEEGEAGIVPATSKEGWQQSWAKGVEREKRGAARVFTKNPPTLGTKGDPHAQCAQAPRPLESTLAPDTVPR